MLETVRSSGQLKTLQAKSFKGVRVQVAYKKSPERKHTRNNNVNTGSIRYRLVNRQYKGQFLNTVH